MKGVLIRPFRLARRLVLLTILAAALVSFGAFGAIRDKAPEAVEAIAGWSARTAEAVGKAAKDALPKLEEAAREALPKIGAAAREALPILKEEIGERIVPAFAEAVGGLRDRLFPDGREAGETTPTEPDGGAVGQDSGESDVPILRRNPDEPAKLALTFDDGPHPTRTAAILDLLAKYGVKATFFVIGENAAAHPEIIERELAEGHEIANHTMTHAALSRLSYRDALTEVTDAERAIFPDGADRTTLLRPPGGAIGQETLRLADRLGLSLVLWSVDTRDWEHKSADAIIKTVRGNVTGGDVILFHDFVSGESHTLEALETLIPELIGKGYELVTVSELFGME